jgi:hypothetical protein
MREATAGQVSLILLSRWLPVRTGGTTGHPLRVVSLSVPLSGPTGFGTILLMSRLVPLVPLAKPNLAKCLWRLALEAF